MNYYAITLTPRHRPSLAPRPRFYNPEPWCHLHWYVQASDYESARLLAQETFPELNWAAYDSYHEKWAKERAERSRLPPRVGLAPVDVHIRGLKSDPFKGYVSKHHAATRNLLGAISEELERRLNLLANDQAISKQGQLYFPSSTLGIELREEIHLLLIWQARFQARYASAIMEWIDEVDENPADSAAVCPDVPPARCD